MPQLTDLNAAIQSAATSGGQRVSIGPNPTFGQRSIPTLFPALVPQLPAESLNFSSVDVTLSGSAALVAAGSAKPTAATVAVTPRQLAKVAGVASLNAEALWESPAVLSSVIATLFSSCVTEQDKIANAALAAAAADPVPATSWIAAIAGGQAAVAAAGGAPNLVIIPATVWPALAGEIAASNGLTTPSGDAIVSILGSRIVLSPEGTGAFVIDPASCVTVTRDAGFLIDAASGATNNVIKCVVDLVQTTFVGIPALVTEISKSP